MKITVTNGKGGVGNTNTAVAIACYLAMLDQATLLADIDLQGNVAMSLGLDPGPQMTTYLDHGPLATLDSGRNHLTILPADGSLESVETVTRIRANMRTGVLDELASRLRIAGDGYAYTVIDTAKQGELRKAAVIAADLVVIPTRLDYNSASNTIAMAVAARTLNPTARIAVLPICKDSRRRRIQNKAIAMITGELHGLGIEACVWAPGIPVSAALENAGWNGKTVYEDPACKPVAAAYSAFAAWLLGKEGDNAQIDN